jgi:hypothetical protein
MRESDVLFPGTEFCQAFRHGAIQYFLRRLPATGSLVPFGDSGEGGKRPPPETYQALLIRKVRESLLLAP